MTKRIAISCPDHIYSVLSGLSAFQGRPKSRVVVELLEEAYPALLLVHDSLNELRLRSMAADGVRFDAYSKVVDDMNDAFNGLLSDMQNELSGVRSAPSSNTGATISQLTDIKRKRVSPDKHKK